MAKKEYTQYQRLMLQRKYMFEGQRYQAEIDAAKLKLAILCIEAAKIGIHINEKGEGMPMDRFAKRAWETLNFRELSITLTGKPINISRNNIPQKYAVEVNIAFNALRKAYERIFNSRYAKIGRAKKRKQLIEQAKRDKKRIQRKVDKKQISLQETQK